MGNTDAAVEPGSEKPVHPHERGEYVNKIERTVTTPGSSPRTWGIRTFGPYAPGARRFIPTNVGNTPGPGVLPSAKAVHPHERGEYNRHCNYRCDIGGSSPRTWGILPRGPEWGYQRRFIPTNVGNTLSIRPIISLISVHPHERGEYVWRLGIGEGVAGSSPRTWGIRVPVLSRALSLRFIPTNVGNTRWLRALKIKIQVHPHERGEYAFRDLPGRNVYGSSPRTWGIRRKETISRIQSRFIPTNVGNTLPTT